RLLIICEPAAESTPARGARAGAARPARGRQRFLILYSPIFLVRVLRCIPRVPAVLIRLPSQRPRTRLMNRFSNSRTASSNCTPRSTISSTSRSSRSLIITASPLTPSLHYSLSRGEPIPLFQLPLRQQTERFNVFLASPVHDVRRQRGDG